MIGSLSDAYTTYNFIQIKLNLKVFYSYFSFIVQNFVPKTMFYVLEMIKMKQLFMIIVLRLAYLNHRLFRMGFISVRQKAKIC